MVNLCLNRSANRFYGRQARFETSAAHRRLVGVNIVLSQRRVDHLNALVATFGFFFDKTLQPPSVAKSGEVKRHAGMWPCPLSSRDDAWPFDVHQAGCASMTL
jgi:hypothetical protein